MGDIADMILDSCDPFNESWHGEFYGEPTAKRCRYCGKGGLFWGHGPKGWRLFDDAGIHVCADYQKSHDD